jgi:uncharacterized phage protein gp47/JayE
MGLRIRVFEEIVSSTISAIGERTGLTNFNVGSVVRTVTEVFSEVVGELYAFAGEALKQAFIQTASGLYLEMRAAERLVTKKRAVATRGVVVFERAVPGTTNILIAQHTVVSTPRDQAGLEYRYVTDEDAVLPVDDMSVVVAVTAEHAGRSYNVVPGSITEIRTHINGIGSVYNDTSWLTVEGADAESDDSLRQRALLAWEELTLGSTARAYRSWALSVPGVASVWVDDTLPRGDGTVDIYILGQGGTPSQALIDSVQAVVNERRPITAHALVRAPEGIEVNVELALTPRFGFDTETIEASVRAALGAYFGSSEAIIPVRALGVGTDVMVSQIIATALSVSGIWDVGVVTPASDVVVDSYQMAQLGELTITWEAASDE